MANRSLLLAVMEDGLKVLSVPSGSIIHLTRPVSMHQFDRFDITNDAEAQKALLKSMTLSEIKALFEQMGVGESDLPRRPKKDALIDRFLFNLTGARQEMDRATASGELPTGGREVHIEVGANTGPQDIIRQLIANGVLPEGAVLPVQANMTPTDVMEMVERYNATSQQTVPTATVPQSVPETRPFAGQGYKLTADEPETAELPQDLSLVVRGAGMSVVAQVSKLNTVKEALVRISYQLLKDSKDEYAALLNASIMNLVKVRTGEVMKDDAELCDYFDQPWGEVKMVMKDSSEQSDVDKAFIASALLLDADVSKVSNNLHLNEKPTNSTGTLTIKVNDDIKMLYHYTSQDRVKDIHSLLEKLDINCDGEDADYRLKYLSSGSFLQSWEPVEATMKGSDICELTVVLRGGAKQVKKDDKQKKDEKHKTYAKAFSEVVKSIKKNDKLECVGLCETKLSAFYAEAETKPIEAFKKLIVELDEETLTKLYSATSSSAGGGVENKLKNASRYLFGAPMMEVYDTSVMCEGILEGAGMATLTAFFTAIGGDNPEKFGLSVLRAMVKTELDKSIGRREARAMEQS